MPPPQLPVPQRSRQDHRVTQGIPPRREQPPSSQPAFSAVQPEVSNLNLATDHLSVSTGSIPLGPSPSDTPTQPHESNGLLTSLVNALSAAAAATAAARAAAATDKSEVTTTAAVVAAIAGALLGY